MTQAQKSKGWESAIFPVELKPFTFTNSQGKPQEVPDRRVIVRTDTDRVLNVVSDRYNLVSHEAIFGPIEEAIGALHLPVTQVKTSLGNGGGYARVMWVLGEKRAVKVGDDVQLMIIGRNSYTYESILELEFGAMRLVCTNGLVSPVSVTKAGGKHVGSLQVSKVIADLSNYLNNSSLVLEAWGKWAEQALPGDRLSGWLERRQALLGKKAQAAINSYYAEREQNLWEAYNAITWFATHQVKGRDEERIPLTQDALQQVALQFARAQLKAGQN